jgi:hypothetical protein
MGTCVKEEHLVRSAFDRLVVTPRLKVCCNVPVLGRCVDLVFIKQGKIHTVEFKIHDVRRAVRQARDHKLAADYSYICLPEKEITEPIYELILDAGVGLFFFIEDSVWPFDTIRKAPRSDETWIVAHEKLRHHLIEKDGSWL